MRIVRYVAAFMLVLALAAGAIAYVAWSRVHAPHKGFASSEVFVDIKPGAGPGIIGEQLVSAGVVRDATTFRLALWITGRARDLKAGEYRFEAPISAMSVIDKLARGDVHRRAVTFREGLTIAEMAAVYQQSGLGDAEAFVKAASDPTPIRELDPDAPDLEGYLFPETYSLPRGTSAADLVAQMVALFKRTFTPALREAITAQGLSVREAVTIASLVEKETAVAEERPVVAAVYLNRKRIGMPMQADPTVIFALQRAGRYDGNIRREDLHFDSPYNTYRYAGLPPGPIAAPGRAALEAVAKPAAVNHLYFVSRNDGSHVFADTLEEHNRNVREWQVEYFRRQRQQQQQSR
jgi:UPF0755 protein